MYLRGEEVRGWRLSRFLGNGGNGEAWKASRAGAAPVAVKFLFSHETDSESYQRFRTEIEAHRKTAGSRGVLPMLEYELPNQASREAPAWLSMPLAVRIRKRLGRTPPLVRVIDAVASIAETLAALQQQGVAHRDIKPNNLFAWNGLWVLGDLGLVTFPGKPQLTRTGRQVGPMHYLAPEMVTDPRRADPYKADVFSLAQTTFVLASGQEYPPRGGVRLAERGATISAWMDEPRAGTLDRLLERATALLPSERPSHEEFAAELRAWLRGPPSRVGPLDLSDLAAGAAALIAREQGEAQRVENLRQTAGRMARDVEGKILPITDEIGRALTGFARGDGSLFSDIVSNNRSRGFGWWVGPTEVAAFVAPGSFAYGLWSGFTFQVNQLGDVLICAGHVVGQGNILGLTLPSAPKPEVRVVWSDSQVVRAGTAQAEQVAATMVRSFAEHARQAVQDLLARLRGSST